MITCIYDYILKKKCIKCMILMHEIACYQTYASVYNQNENKDLAKILNRVLSPYLHTRAYTHTHTRANIGTCVTRGGFICRHVVPSFLSMPNQLPCHHSIKFFLLNLIQNKSI